MAMTRRCAACNVARASQWEEGVEMTKRVVLIELTRDRADNPTFQRLAGRLAEGARALAAREFDAQLLYADELDVEELIAATTDAAAVVFLGGEDVDPVFYDGATQYQGGGTHNSLADQREIALIRYLERGRIPVLGICRGAQIVNVALGGTLVQHLEVPGHRNPNILQDLTLVTHPVRIEQPSKVAQAMSANTTARRDGDHVVVDVHSAHHQAIEKPGRGLRVVARSADGVIEAVEHENAPILGVQWHPEDPNSSGEQVSYLLRILTDEQERASLVAPLNRN